PVAPARYAVVAPSRRAAALRDALDVLDPKRPFVWEGGPLDAPAETPDAVLCLRLPTRQQLAALAQLGEPVVFVTAAQLPYLRSLAAPLTPLRLSGETDRARDRVEALRAQVAAVLETGAIDAELALLDPLFDHFDPAEVAAALLALRRETGKEKRETSTAQPAGPAWVKVFVNVGKKDRTAAKDLVGALIREVGVQKDDLGRIDVRDTFSLVEVPSALAGKIVRGLSGVTIKGRRALARIDRQA
ncbi:MAG TPA: DbpA RNA binding domain-containing protein, partial [Gemmatimonadales bacterium]